MAKKNILTDPESIEKEETVVEEPEKIQNEGKKLFSSVNKEVGTRLN